MIVSVQPKNSILASLSGKRGSMNISPQKSISINVKDSIAWYKYLRSVLDLLWIGEVDGNFLVSCFADKRKIIITNKDFTGNYIPYSSGAIFKLPPDPDLIADDIDHLWFDIIEAQIEVSVTDLVSGDYRTIVKYADEDPFDVYMIGVLRKDVILSETQINYLSRDFWLWLFWSGVWNDSGRLKDNRETP
jgi:hypothetical protein